MCVGDAKPSIPSVDNTLSAVRLRRSFDDLAKKLQFTSMEDFYTLDSAKVVEHFGMRALLVPNSTTDINYHLHCLLALKAVILYIENTGV